jgi:hypothetical protein
LHFSGEIHLYYQSARARRFPLCLQWTQTRELTHFHPHIKLRPQTPTTGYVLHREITRHEPGPHPGPHRSRWLALNPSTLPYEAIRDVYSTPTNDSIDHSSNPRPDITERISFIALRRRVCLSTSLHITCVVDQQVKSDGIDTGFLQSLRME